MNYKDFLETPYWKTISQYAKCNADFECELCGNNEELHLHHKTYTRHGYEHLPEVIDKDLIVLCNKCHAKLHNKN